MQRPRGGGGHLLQGGGMGEGRDEGWDDGGLGCNGHGGDFCERMTSILFLLSYRVPAYSVPVDWAEADAGECAVGLWEMNTWHGCCHTNVKLTLMTSHNVLVVVVTV